jgi:hypothetical protein
VVEDVKGLGIRRSQLLCLVPDNNPVLAAGTVSTFKRTMLTTEPALLNVPC